MPTHSPLAAKDFSELVSFEAAAAQRFDAHRQASLNLDLTRGKPSLEQVALSAALDGILHGDYLAQDGTDTRGYGGLDGIPEMRALAAKWLALRTDEVMVLGNSSLELMYLFLLRASLFGLTGPASAWSRDPAGAKFICPVPGYDRHFTVCESLGIEMVTVPMRQDGPDMDQVEALVKDPAYKGLWCVPRHSNPSGEIYSDNVVERIAALGKTRVTVVPSGLG